MKTIIPLGKYNLNTNRFESIVLDSEKNKALSYIEKKVIYDENDENFEYIILASGNKVQDISRDGINPIKEYAYEDSISRYFKDKKKNCIIIHILVDMDAPLDEESRLIAEKIDEIAENPTTSTINLIGHSKCGTMFFNMPKYFQNEESFRKSNIYTSAAPFQGCLIASPRFFLGQVEQVINDSLPKPLNKLVFKALKKYYTTVHSDSHMDNDISKIGTKAERYDPGFIAGMFDLQNIEAIKRVNFYHNFSTGIDDKSLLKALRRRDYLGIGLCLMDKFFMRETTDGFIEVKSQESVEQYVDVRSTRISSATHYYLGHDDEFKVILDMVNQNIDRNKAKKKEKIYVRLYPNK